MLAWSDYTSLMALNIILLLHKSSSIRSHLRAVSCAYLSLFYIWSYFLSISINLVFISYNYFSKLLIWFYIWSCGLSREGGSGSGSGRKSFPSILYNICFNFMKKEGLYTLNDILIYTLYHHRYNLLVYN